MYCKDEKICNFCFNGFTRHPFNTSLCLTTCPRKWYVDENNNYKCASNCGAAIKREIEAGTQCVASCKPDKCVACKSEGKIYNSSNVCSSTCKSGYNGNDITFQCEPEGGYCKKKIRTESVDCLNNGVVDCQNYLNTYNNSYRYTAVDYVDIIKLSSSTIQIFKIDDCQQEISSMYGLAYINLTDCQTTLMKKFKLSENQFAIVKIDTNVTEGAQKLQVNYAAYNVLTGQKLDLSYCNKINMTIPLENNNILSTAKRLSSEGIDVYNNEDTFFTDFCYPYFNENGDDVIMSVRRQNYYQSQSLCGDSCTIKNIDYDLGKVDCECPAGSSVTNVEKEDFEEESAFDKPNVVVLKCYNLVFNLNYFKKNVGQILMTIICFVQLPCVISFVFITQFKTIYAYLSQFVRIKLPQKKKENESAPPRKKRKKNNNDESEDSEDDYEKVNSKESKSPGKFLKLKKEPQSLIDSNSISVKSKTKLKKSEHKANFNEEEPSSYNKSMKMTNSKKNRAINNFALDDDSTDTKKFYTKTKKPHKLIILNQTKYSPVNDVKNSPSFNYYSSNNFLKTNSNFMSKKSGRSLKSGKITTFLSAGLDEMETKVDFYENDSDYLDEMEFSNARNKDFRGLCHLTWRYMKKKVCLIYPFVDISVFESFSIKMTVLIFNISLYFCLNGLLFTSDYFTKRFETEGSKGLSYFFSNELAKSIIAAFISAVVGVIVIHLTTSKRKFVSLMNGTSNEKEFLNKSKSLIDCLKIKLIIFFVLNFVLMAFFWYYVSAFCACYQKTQVGWLEGAIMTIIFCFIFQSFYAFILALFRTIGLYFKIKCFYSISKCLM